MVAVRNKEVTRCERGIDRDGATRGHQVGDQTVFPH